VLVVIIMVRFFSFFLGMSKALIANSIPPLHPNLPGDHRSLSVMPHAHTISILIQHFFSVFAPHLYSYRTPPFRL
jgi:hypothetical protein